MINELMQRSGSCCELCNATGELAAYVVSPRTGTSAADAVLLCPTCMSLVQQDPAADTDHWRCLNGAIWSEFPVVKVLSWRILSALNTPWAAELTDSIWLDEDEAEWARSGSGQAAHKDSNGAVLQQGDTVVLIKDLEVKGAGFTAKRGTAVRNIRLVEDQPSQIEGKVEGQQIVILTQYVKKQ